MANIRAALMRSDRLTDWQTTNKPVGPGEVVVANNDDTGVAEHIVIGRKDPNSPAALTPFNALELLPLFTQEEREKLDGLHLQTGPEMVTLINATLGIDLATMAAGGGYSAAQIINLLTQYFAVEGQEPTASSPTWSRVYVSSINGKDVGDTGAWVADADQFPMSAIAGLLSALAGTAPALHDHTISQIEDLSPTLASKIPASYLGVVIPTIDPETDKIDLQFLPSSIGQAVTSVLGRTGDVVAMNGDYSAGQVTNTPAGTITEATVQLALNQLDTLKQPLSAKAQANGYCDLDSSGYVPTARLKPADSDFPFSVRVPWVDGSTNANAAPPGEQQIGSQARTTQIDLRKAVAVTATVYVGSTPAPTNGGFRFKYATAADGYSAWTTLCEVVADNALGAGVQRWGTPVTVPEEAKTQTTRIRCYTFGGDAATNWAYALLGMDVSLSVPLLSGAQSGAAIIALIDGVIGTAWKTGAADNSMTLAKLVNATAANVLIGATAAGAWQQINATTAKSLLGLPSSFVSSLNGRSGAVTLQAGDVGADIVAESATRVFITPEQKVAYDRIGNISLQTGPASGLLGGTDDTAITATTSSTFRLTNDAAVKRGVVRNFSSVPHTLLPASGQQMLNALGADVLTAGITIPAATSATAPSAMCFVRPAPGVWRLA